MMQGREQRFITGNSFPMGLICRGVRIFPETLENYRLALAHGTWSSYWGHPNTLAAAAQQCGVELTPRTERPALTVDAEGYPMLNNERFAECWVLTPEYKPGFRPALQSEVPADQITGWKVLHMIWDTAATSKDEPDE